MVVQRNERAQAPRPNCQATHNACEEDNNKKPANREIELHACAPRSCGISLPSFGRDQAFELAIFPAARRAARGLDPIEVGARLRKIALRDVKRAGVAQGRVSAAKRISAAENLDSHADVPWFRLRPILYNPYRDVWACRAFKRSFVVIRLIRLNAGQPHL
jgi:hypothetical protein